MTFDLFQSFLGEKVLCDGCIALFS